MNTLHSDMTDNQMIMGGAIFRRPLVGMRQSARLDGRRGQVEHDTKALQVLCVGIVVDLVDLRLVETCYTSLDKCSVEGDEKAHFALNITILKRRCAGP